jgi:hypothetical protein
MAFNFILKEDGGHLLQEDGVSNLILNEIQLPQKINLEVKRTVATSTDVEYTFRITSHDPVESIDLSNYRIVQYLNTRWPGSLTYGLGQVPTPFGGAGPGLAVFAAPDDIAFITEDKPPHIYPERDRFSIKRATRFVQGTLPLSGSGYEGNSITTHHGVNTWSTNSDTRYDYEPEHCYTATTATDFEDNHTFVLEFNSTETKTNPTSPDWAIVTEYITSATIDPETSVYPLSADGDNTKTYNRIVYPTKDNIIKELFPATVFNSDPLHLLRKGPGANVRILEYYPISVPFRDQVLALGTSAESLTDVRAAEFWKYTVNTFTATTMDLNMLSSDFDSSTATWNTEVDNVSANMSDTNFTGLSVHDNLEFARWEITDKDIIKSWMIPTTSANNKGVVTKYEVESSPVTEGPYFSSLETTLGNETRPAFVINTNFILGGEQIWTGAINSNWSNPGNWQNNEIPSIGSVAAFDGGVSTVPCVLDSNQSVYNLTSNAGSGSINLSSFDLTIEGSICDFNGFSSLTQETGGKLILINSCVLNLGQEFATASLQTLEITENAHVNYFADKSLRLTENFNVSGTFMMHSNLTLDGAQSSFGENAIIDSERSGSTALYTITLFGGSLSNTGTLNTKVHYTFSDNVITGRFYGGKVSVSNDGSPFASTTTMTFGDGQHTYLDGLFINSSQQGSLLVIDASANDPDILMLQGSGLLTIATGFPPEDELIFLMGSKDWIISTDQLDLAFVDSFDLGGGGGFYVNGDTTSIMSPLTDIIMPPLTINSSTEVIDINNNIYTQNFTMNIGSTVNFNHFNISAVDAINISGNSDSVNLLSGTSLAASNINIVGDPLDYIDLSTEEFWYISASDTLDVVHVDLKSSDASGGVTGIAIRSNDLGEP